MQRVVEAGEEPTSPPTPRALAALGWLPLPIGLIAGVVAALGPAEPTGTPAIDAVLIVASMFAVVVVGRLAPWWTVVMAAGTATAIAIDPLPMLAGVVALAGALWAGRDGRPQPVVQAVCLAITGNVFARSGLGGRLGLSAVIAVAALGLVLVTGIQRHPARVRRVAWGAVFVLVVLAGAASAMLGYAVYKAKGDLSGGQRTAELGVVALENDDFEEAAEWFRQSAELLDRANSRLDSAWTAPAALVPVVAQHRSAVVDLGRVGADGAHTVTTALDEIDLETLRPQNGRLDVTALESLSGPLGRVHQALLELQRATDAARSPWLVPRAVAALDDFTESIDEHLPSLERALDAIALAPGMLGADEPRDYLVLFTTPSEARGLGGMPGSYAELRADGGALSLGAVGRVSELDERAREAGAVVRGHEDFLAQYARFGYDGPVGNAAFRNLTMSPDFPTVASIAADLYAQTTGREVDGVVVVDAVVFSTLLRYTGPIELTTLPETITPDNATEFLLRGQYVAAEGDTALRADALGEAASLTFRRLIGGALPEPIGLARDMGPLVADRRLMMWSADAEEQALLLDSTAAGALPTPDGGNGWAVTVTNGSGNKIDSFLRGSAAFSASTDGAGITTSTLELELVNDAPSEGLPRYVIGNRLGLPNGTSRLYVSLYSATPLRSLRIDGVPTGVTIGSERGWTVTSFYVDFAPGQARAFEARWEGQVADPDRVVTFTQPLASPITAS